MSSVLRLLPFDVTSGRVHPTSKRPTSLYFFCPLDFVLALSSTKTYDDFSVSADLAGSAYCRAIDPSSFDITVGTWCWKFRLVEQISTYVPAGVYG